MGSLRTILALAVVFAHSPWNDGFVFVGGRNAVQLFYMISGFVISHVLLNTAAYRDVRVFYMSRVLRLYPVYLVVLALSAVLWFGLGSKFASFYERIPGQAAFLLSVVNLSLVGQDVVMFLGIEHGDVRFTGDFRDSEVPLFQGLLVPQAWTLSLELMFYAVAPFVIRRRNVLLLILAVSICARVVAMALGWGMHDPWTYRFFPFEIAFFIVGALSNQLLLPHWQALSISRPSWRLPMAGTITLAVLSISYFVIPLSEWIKTPVLFLSFVVLMPLAFVFQQQWRFDGIFGELSYPIYISHMLAIWIVGYLLARLGVSEPFVVTLAFAISSIAASCLLYFVVVRQVEGIRRKLRGERSAAFKDVLSREAGARGK